MIPSPVATQAAISKHDSALLANTDPFVNAVGNSTSNSIASVQRHVNTTVARMRLNWCYVLFHNGWPKNGLAKRGATSYARDAGPSFRPKTHCGEVLPSLWREWIQEGATP